MRAAFVVAMLLAVVPGCKNSEPIAPHAEVTTGADSVPEATVAPLFEGLGDYHRAITASAEAQRYFNQGMVLSFGFNHAEAERSFRQGAAVDRNCAMCWWGVAYVLGPNINAPMDPSVNGKATAALYRARMLGPMVTSRERAYISALEARYADEPPEDRGALDEAYAEALQQLSEADTADTDAKVLYAEALMDLHPWNYWDLKSGQARAWTPQIRKVLEDVIATVPEHPLANHLYIHLMEASKQPELALPSAERLPGLAPTAGHLVHMPSHIYIRVGEYQRASEANVAAIAADQDYITQCRAQGSYPLAYHPHNYHFLSRTASLEGRGAVAIDAAVRMRDHVEASGAMRETGLETLQHFYATAMYTMARFGRWEDILAYPKPEADLVYPIGVWHYTRGMAFVGKGELDKATVELARVAEIAIDPRIERITVWDINTAVSLMQIAEQALAGEIAAKRGDLRAAIAHLRKAVALEDKQNYDEPPSWYFSTRHALGAIYLQAKRPRDAERVYREDLAVFPNNGWALFGLARALDMRGKARAAQKVRARFEKAWSRADVKLVASRFN